MTEPLFVKWKLFIPWLKSKPAEHQYVYGDIRNCILCQFLKETHGIEVIAGGSDISERNSPYSTAIPEDIKQAIQRAPKTTGGILSRLESKGEA